MSLYDFLWRWLWWWCWALAALCLWGAGVLMILAALMILADACGGGR